MDEDGYIYLTCPLCRLRFRGYRTRWREHAISHDDLSIDYECEECPTRLIAMPLTQVFRHMRRHIPVPIRGRVGSGEEEEDEDDDFQIDQEARRHVVEEGEDGLDEFLEPVAELPREVTYSFFPLGSRARHEIELLQFSIGNTEARYREFASTDAFRTYFADMPVTKKTLVSRLLSKFKGMFQINKTVSEGRNVYSVNGLDIIRIWMSRPAASFFVKEANERFTSPFIDDIPGKLADMNEAIASGSHCFSEYWTGLRWYEVLEETKNHWHPRQNPAYESVFVHLVLFADAFTSTTTGFLASHHAFYLSLAEFPSWAKWNSSFPLSPLPFLMPLAIVDDDQIKTMGINEIVKIITEGFRSLLDGHLVWSSAHGGLVKVFGVFHALLGDLPGRAHIVGMRNSSVSNSFCNYCDIQRLQIRPSFMDPIQLIECTIC